MRDDQLGGAPDQGQLGRGAQIVESARMIVEGVRVRARVDLAEIEACARGGGDLPFLELTADSGPPEGQPAVLAGFIAGERALRLGAMPALQRRQLVIDDLVAYWGPEAAKPLELVEQDWNKEPWSGGAFTSFVIPGTWTGPARLVAANHSRVIWAGSEASPRWPGYFEGAIEAGERAAATALGELPAN